MSKSLLMAGAATLIILGAVAAIKSFVPATSRAPSSAAVPARTAKTPSPTEMFAIMPAPVIDTNAETFVGTGDGSGGAWVRPDGKH